MVQDNYTEPNQKKKRAQKQNKLHKRKYARTNPIKFLFS